MNFFSLRMCFNQCQTLFYFCSGMIRISIWLAIQVVLSLCKFGYLPLTLCVCAYISGSIWGERGYYI